MANVVEPKIHARGAAACAKATGASAVSTDDVAQITCLRCLVNIEKAKNAATNAAYRIAAWGLVSTFGPSAHGKVQVCDVGIVRPQGDGTVLVAAFIRVPATGEDLGGML